MKTTSSAIATRTPGEPPASAHAVPDRRRSALVQRHYEQTAQSGHRHIQLTTLASMMNGSSRVRQLQAKAEGMVVQRYVDAEWMPANYVGFKAENYGGDTGIELTDAVEAYLAIPVGENMEYLSDLAARADELHPNAEPSFTARYTELAQANKPNTIAELQRLATDINAIYDRYGERENRDRQNRWPQAVALAHDYLQRPVEQYVKADQSLFLTWQKQLRHAATGKLDSRQHDQEVIKFVDMISSLTVRPDYKPEPVYDTSWKTQPVSAPVTVDSGGAVVGATLLLEGTLGEKIRKRMTVSKARHMWDYLDATTNEDANSLIAAGADLSTVEQDMRELGSDYVQKYQTNTYKAAYSYTTSNARTYRINKTDADYPHCYPVDGADVVPMDKALFNFHADVRLSRSLVQDPRHGPDKVRELLKTHSVTARKEEVTSTAQALKLPSSLEKAIHLGFEPPTVFNSAKDSKEGRPKWSEPRTKPGPKLTATGEPVNREQHK